MVKLSSETEQATSEIQKKRVWESPQIEFMELSLTEAGTGPNIEGDGFTAGS